MRILTTDSHYQINEFSLPTVVLTTTSMNSHYRAMFSLPEREGEGGRALGMMPSKIQIKLIFENKY